MLVERGDVDDQDVRIVDRMARLRRIGPGGIVLDVDARPTPLSVRQDARAILEPVPGVLEDDEVDVEVTDLVLGYLVDPVGRPSPSTDATMALTVVVADRQEELVTRVDQGVEVTAVDMPREDAKGQHGTRWHRR